LLNFSQLSLDRAKFPGPGRSRQCAITVPNIKNKNFGSTALHVAAYYGHKDLVELLLINGADHKIKNNLDNIPLDEACNKEI